MKMKDREYERYTYTHDNRYGWIAVHGWGIYPESSVLAGQPMKTFLDSFDSVEDALKAYPTATPSSKWTEPQNTFNHLPGPDDPVEGGAYPDDIGAEWSRQGRIFPDEP